MYCYRRKFTMELISPLMDPRLATGSILLCLLTPFLLQREDFQEFLAFSRKDTLNWHVMQYPKLCFTWDIGLSTQLHKCKHIKLLCDVFHRAVQGVLWIWEISELACAYTLVCTHGHRALGKKIVVVFLESFWVPHWKRTWQKYGIPNL